MVKTRSRDAGTEMDYRQRNAEVRAHWQANEQLAREASADPLGHLPQPRSADTPWYVSDGTCEVCSRGPAADITLRRLDRERFRRFSIHRFDGTLCRDCGLAAQRQYSNTSLLRGWLVFLGNVFGPLMMLWNIGASVKLKRLDDPTGGNLFGGRAPLSPGQPLWLRSGPWVSAVIVGLVITLNLLVLNAVNNGDVLVQLPDTLQARLPSWMTG